MNIAQRATGKPRYNRQRSRTLYMYLYTTTCGMCCYALMHRDRLVRTGADPQHARGGVCPTFMYIHLYFHALVFLYLLWATAHSRRGSVARACRRSRPACITGLKPSCLVAYCREVQRIRHPAHLAYTNVCHYEVRIRSSTHACVFSMLGIRPQLNVDSQQGIE